MAQATKRTSVLLGVLAFVFLCIIIILCIIPDSGSPEGRSKPISGVIVETTTSTTSTSTTTSTTTTTTTPPTSEATTPTTTTDVTTSKSTTDEPTTVSSTLKTTPGLATDESTTVSSTLETTPDYVTDESTTVSSTLETTPDLATDESTTVSSTLETTPGYVTDESTTVSSTLETTPDLATDESTTVSSTLETTPGFVTDESTTVSSTLDTTPGLATDESTTVSSTLETTPGLATDESTTVSSTLETTPGYVTSESTTVSSTLETTPDLATDESTTVSSTLETTPGLTTDESTTVATTTPIEQPTTETSEPQSSTPCNPVALEVCETPACKTVASNMLAMMDHSPGVSPCTDFYQYACGGVMQNPFLHPRQPGIIAERMIKDQLDKSDNNDTVKSKMSIFYKSCLDAMDQDTREDWTQPIKTLFGQHKFELSAIQDEGDFNFNLNVTLATMMKNDFTPFFNMELEVNREDNTEFLLNLHPVVPGSRFSEDLARKICLEEHHRSLTSLKDMGSYNVEEEYNDFMKCVRTGNGLEARLTRMEEAVRRLGLMDHLDADSSNQLLQHTISSTRDLLSEFSEVLPYISQLEQDLTNKNCFQKGISDLSKDYIDWETVVNELLDVTDSYMYEVKVYMQDTIEVMESVLKDYYDENPANLNNILLMLWSERLYTDFVKPVDASVGEHEYCLRTTIALMEDAASYLYLDALSQEEINARREQIHSIVANVRRAGETAFQHNYKNSEATDKLKKMLEDVITADIENVENTAISSTEQVNLTSDFIKNSLQLLTNRRKLIYEMKRENTRDGWRMFMRPYDPFGVHIYTMDEIMIPYAAQEPSSFFKNIPDYLNYAGIGHMISHLVWHGYDTSGLSFQHDEFRSIPGYQAILDTWTDLKEQYQAPQSYINPNGLAANFSMGTLSWNELLADSGAIPLAWEAYLIRNEPKPTDPTEVTGKYDTFDARRRRRSLNAATDPPFMDSQEKPLPWLSLSPIQLYYLHWAQHHCSASSELSMLEVMESKQPPARMRVNLALQNEPLFHKAFTCPMK